MPVEQGQPAPVIESSYPDFNGDDYSIAEALKNGPVLLGIYKSSCAASKAMMPALGRVADAYRDRGLTTYGIAQDSPNITASFARRGEIEYPLLIEGDDYPVSIAFDIFATPTVFVISPDGTVAYTTMGFMRPQLNDIGNAVADLLGIEPVEIISEGDETYPLFVPG